MSEASNRHPPAEVLRAFGEGKVYGPASDAVVAHLTACAHCRRLVANLLASGLGARRPAPATPAPTATAPAPPSPSNIPPELAKHPDYRILRELGRGRMGVVYLARNQLMDRDEVLKIAHGSLVEESGASERFLKEIRSAAQLMHVNIVRAYSVLRLGRILVLCMEHAPGANLGVLVHQDGPLSVPNACNCAAQVALGLQHACEKNMVHRDIKPSNLIVSQDGKKHVVKILDFGLAQINSEASSGPDPTGNRRMIGAPAYIAPEQISNAAGADIQADIYSLGCTLYFLLTGAPPFHGKSLPEVLHAHKAIEPTRLNLLNPEVPPELATVVARMMAKELAKRYRTPADVARELTPFKKAGAAGPFRPQLDLGPRSRQKSPPKKRRS